MKQFSSNPSNELFILKGTDNDYANSLFSKDGTKYWTTNCSDHRLCAGSWELYWGSYMNETSDLFDSPYSYLPSTNDTSSIYSTFIDYNNDEQLISFPLFDTTTYNTLVVFLDHDTGPIGSKSFICPPVTNCILICMDRIGVSWSLNETSCNSLYGVFSLAQNGLLITTSRSMNIYGSSNSFKTSFYGSVTKNNFYLQNTAHIVWDCAHTIAPRYCSCYENNLYTGVSLDVTLLCGDFGCMGSTLFSDLNPTQYLLYTLWNINCHFVIFKSCSNFVLNFNNSQWCIYYDYENTTCTKFLDPTSNPTQNPSIYPTDDPTIDPSINPTPNPIIHFTTKTTQSPSHNPSSTPTILPTQATTVSSGLPSEDPTMEPIKIIEADAGNNQLLVLEPGVQYMLTAGLLFVFILSIVVCTKCYVVRMKNKTNPKLVNGQHVMAMSDDIDERDNKDAAEIEVYHMDLQKEHEQPTADEPSAMHDRDNNNGDGFPGLHPQDVCIEGGQPVSDNFSDDPDNEMYINHATKTQFI